MRLCHRGGSSRFSLQPAFILSAAVTQRQPDAQPDQYDARAPALNARPERPARDQPGERSAGQRNRQIGWYACDLKQQPEDKHLRARFAVCKLNELRQESKKEQNELRIE